MIVFDRLEDALEEAQFCASTERAIYYIVNWKGRFRVSKKGRGRFSRARIEVGFGGDKS
jgi:hypothetical protein